MPLRPLSRQQTWLMPPSLDELVPPDHPARFVGAMVDAVERAEWSELGIRIEGEPLGAPAYHPRALLSVWLYGFMTRVRSSRKLEAACRDQMPYLWLTGWQHPDHNTLWRFYKSHRDRMRQLLKRTVRMAVEMGLLDMAVQAVDGTKVAANAGSHRTYKAEELRKLLGKTEAAIEDLERQNEAGDDPPPPHLPEKLAEAERLRSEMKAALERLEEEGRKHTNLTDGDATFMKTRQGIVPGYNAQAMVCPVETPKAEEAAGEKKAGLLVTAADVVIKTTDTEQLMPMLKQAEENTGKQADISLADAGYHSGANLQACELRGQVMVMPESQDRALKHPYHKDRFSYEEATDSYICPHGQSLPFRRIKSTKGTIVREYTATGAWCRNCPAFGVCTRNGRGRKLEIRPQDTALRRHRAWMETEEAKAAYSRRKELVEPAFGIIKEQMGVRRFLLRGLVNVRAEFAMVATAFNLLTLWRLTCEPGTRKPLSCVADASRGLADRAVAMRFHIHPTGTRLLAANRYS